MPLTPRSIPPQRLFASLLTHDTLNKGFMAESNPTISKHTVPLLPLTLRAALCVLAPRRSRRRWLNIRNATTRSKETRVSQIISQELIQMIVSDKVPGLNSRKSCTCVRQMREKVAFCGHFPFGSRSLARQLLPGNNDGLKHPELICIIIYNLEAASEAGTTWLMAYAEDEDDEDIEHDEYDRYDEIITDDGHHEGSH
ncbi:hypothetical protein VPNG_09588 [Cytospora leucostoma]|uniref:Uncharacterized protein n=1 Tax=Cytospora leucostoma TaxID=1230097 RepID=A0A423VN42_9PEZI|nr:hypothetical protein VPNG_09588 [Cytospora leucostoma]